MHSLASRIVLVTVALVALAVSIAIGGSWMMSQRIASQAVTESLAASQAMQRYLQYSRARELVLTTDLLAADPHDTAYLVTATRGQLDDEGVDRVSILELIDDRRREMGFDFAMMLDPDGQVLARTDRPETGGQTMAGHPLVAPVLAELIPEYGLWQDGTRLYSAAVVPIATAFEVVGFLVTGLAIDDNVAADIKRVTGVDMIFTSLQNDQPVAVASTLDMRRTDYLVQQLAGQDNSGRLVAGEAIERLDVRIGGENWVARIEPLVDGTGTPLGGVMTVDSLDARLAGHRTLQAALIGGGGLAVLIAFGLSLLVARRIARPVEALAEVSEKAAQGDYEQDINIERKDEVGTLARAITRLLADLREQQEIAGYVSDLSQHLEEGAAEPARETDSATVAISAPAATPSDTLIPGHLLGERFEIIERLGSGAMGSVYKARDHKLDDVVALKLLKPELTGNPEYLERMKSEIRLARRITHPNVLRTHDFFEIDGLPLISMEYVRGITLDQLLTRSGRLGLAAGLRIATQVLQGLDAAHKAGVLHRDIKPANIILDPRGNARLMDFGIARQTAGSQSTDLTQPGTLVGTANYMAPEIVLGKPAGPGSDIYSMGVTMTEVFTGQLPFEGRTAMEVCMAHVQKAPKPPSALWPEIPEALEAAILKCLPKNPEDRFKSAEELLNTLLRFRRQSAASTRIRK